MILCEKILLLFNLAQTNWIMVFQTAATWKYCKNKVLFVDALFICRKLPEFQEQKSPDSGNIHKSWQEWQDVSFHMSISKTQFKCIELYR